ncbi:hypothetical protein ACFCYX_11250 [Streptomyces populi]|uniref:hypothetical protein n=1 Tax=Streptomyces populi TaxID=2058924 RepID=UPI0013A6C4E6|nr:hypothetical protein [Streptomyces populi]
MIVVPLLLAEFGEVAPWIAVKIVRWGARFVGDHERTERYKEEWAAGLDTVPGKLSKLLKALGILCYAVPRMRLQVRRDVYRWRCFRVLHAVTALCMPPVAARMARKRAGNYQIYGLGSFTTTLRALTECLEEIVDARHVRWIIPCEQVLVREHFRVTLDHRQGRLLMESLDSSTTA